MSIFSDGGTTFLDVAWLSAVFLLTVISFSFKEKRQAWINHLLVLVLAIYWLVAFLFREPPLIKLLATVLFLAAVVIKIAVARKRDLKAG